MSNSKTQIKSFLEGKEWENSKHAFSEYCKTHPKANPSPIYFYRVFASIAIPVRKKETITSFIKGGNFASCKEAFAAYAVGEKQFTSFNYFVQLYTAANRGNKKKAEKVITMEVTPISISTMKAKEIIAKVAELTGTTITVNLKNKNAIIKQATAELNAKGFATV